MTRSCSSVFEEDQLHHGVGSDYTSMRPQVAGQPNLGPEIAIADVLVSRVACQSKLALSPQSQALHHQTEC